jgi:hypothetical protein
MMQKSQSICSLLLIQKYWRCSSGGLIAAGSVRFSEVTKKKKKHFDLLAYALETTLQYSISRDVYSVETDIQWKHRSAIKTQGLNIATTKLHH